MLPFTKNPNSSELLIVDCTPQLALNATPAEKLSSGASAALGSGTDGALTITAAAINSSDVFPASARPKVPANQGIQFRAAGGTNGYVFTDPVTGVQTPGYPVDVSAVTNAGNTIAERVFVVVSY
jgi:hypothetical protein